jgi:hypothetical protein
MSPDSGVVFAIVKNPISPSGGRLLAILDVTTGQAMSIGNTGFKLAGLTFGEPWTPDPPTAAPALGPLGLAALAVALVSAALARKRGVALGGPENGVRSIKPNC